MADERAKPDSKAAAKKRLAEALRANLKRRKAAAGRGATGDEGPAPTAGDGDRAGKD